MPKKFKIFLGVLAAVLVVCLCAGLVVLLLHSRNVDRPMVPIESEVIVETTEEFVPIGPQYEDIETTVATESVEYNNDVLSSPAEISGIIFFCGLFDFIHVEEFSNALFDEFESVRVLNYNGGRHGVFDVKIETESGVIEGIWDDSSQTWYSDRSEYVG